MINYNPDNNLVGQEPKKEVKKKQPVNCWIPIENYLPSVQHKFLLVDIGVDYILGTIGLLMKKKTIMTCDFYGDPAYSIKNVKRVMILSRK